jgi:hypothetical protein
LKVYRPKYFFLFYCFACDTLFKTDLPTQIKNEICDFLIKTQIDVRLCFPYKIQEHPVFYMRISRRCVIINNTRTSNSFHFHSPSAFEPWRTFEPLGKGSFPKLESIYFYPSALSLAQVYIIIINKDGHINRLRQILENVLYKYSIKNTVYTIRSISFCIHFDKSYKIFQNVYFLINK